MDLFTQEKTQNNDALLLGLFKAYRDARKNKRVKRTQVAFEFDHEKKLMRLHKNIVNRRYKPLQSTAFISTKPVIREVFAAHFQDRVVHHLIFKQLSPVFESLHTPHISHSQGVLSYVRSQYPLHTLCKYRT